MNRQTGFIKKADLYVAVGILMLAALAYLPTFLSRQSNYKIVIANEQGSLYELNSQDLKAKGAFSYTAFAPGGNFVTFNLDPSAGVRVSSASCPDKVCLQAGYINKVPQSVVCLPNKIYAQIIPLTNKEDNLDAILH